MSFDVFTVGCKGGLADSTAPSRRQHSLRLGATTEATARALLLIVQKYVSRFCDRLIFIVLKEEKKQPLVVWLHSAANHSGWCLVLR